MNVVAGSGAGGSAAGLGFLWVQPLHLGAQAPVLVAQVPVGLLQLVEPASGPTGLGERPEGDEQGNACQKTGPDH